MYKVKTRYYSEKDQFGESYVITSDNSDIDTKLENGCKVRIVPICENCGKDGSVRNDEESNCLGVFCDGCYKRTKKND